MKRTLALTLLLFSASSAAAEVFTWTDKGGARHFTNSIHEVPARYRSKVKVLDVPTGRKYAPTPAQLAGQSQPEQGAGAPAAPPAAVAAPALPPASLMAPAQSAPVASPPPSRPAPAPVVTNAQPRPAQVQPRMRGRRLTHSSPRDE